MFSKFLQTSIIKPILIKNEVGIVTLLVIKLSYIDTVIKIVATGEVTEHI